MDITVRNDGEPAYSSEMFISVPQDVPIINKDFCETRSKLERNIIACFLGNPLFKDKQVCNLCFTVNNTMSILIFLCVCAYIFPQIYV